MKAEQYMKGEDTSISCNELEKGTDIVEETIALKAIKIAREEEREKAIKALDIAIMAIFERNTHSVSMGELRA